MISLWRDFIIALRIEPVPLFPICAVHINQSGMSWRPIPHWSLSSV